MIKDAEKIIRVYSLRGLMICLHIMVSKQFRFCSNYNKNNWNNLGKLYKLVYISF